MDVVRVNLSSRAASMDSQQRGAPKVQDSIAEPTFVGLAVLFRAHRYAVDTGSDIWDFAVEIAHLRSLGLTDSDLRWLARKGYVEHAREVTVQGHDGREFQSTGDLTFRKRTCFVLTADGVSKAGYVAEDKATLTDDVNGPGEENGQTVQSPTPHWDAETRELRMNGQVVKRFKWHALNQEAVLAVFEEEGWPVRIDDPIPPQPEQDPKRRLSDTIKCLNRKQTNELIRFHGDGTGEGVTWELVGQDGSDEGPSG